MHLQLPLITNSLRLSYIILRVVNFGHDVLHSARKSFDLSKSQLLIESLQRCRPIFIDCLVDKEETIEHKTLTLYSFFCRVTIANLTIEVRVKELSCITIEFFTMTVEKKLHSNMEYETLSWDQLKPQYATYVSDSLTSVRIPVLKRLQVLISGGEITDLNAVSLVLLKTFNYYQDVNSRNQVLVNLESIIKVNPNYLSVFIKYINHTVSKSVMAATDYLTLLNWINRFLVLSTSADLIELAIRSQAIILFNSISTSHKQNLQHRRRVYASVLTSTKTSLIEALVSAEKEETYLEIVINALTKSTLPSEIVLTYFGILSEAVADALPVKPLYFELMKTLKVQVLEYFSNVLLDKVAPSTQSVEIFGNFVENFVTEDDFTVLLPTIEKSILRSSENAFIILPPFFKYLKADVFSTGLTSTILTNLKSTKEDVRHGAYKCLEYLLKNSNESSLKFADEVIKTLKTTSNTDSKSLLSKALSLITNQDASAKIALDLLPLLPKDQNETSLASLVHSFVLHAFRNGDFQKLSPQFKLGLSDKNLPLKRIWYVEVGEALFNNKHDERIVSFVNDIHTTLVKTLEEAQLAPLPTIANKGISGAYVAITILHSFNIGGPTAKSLVSNGEKPAVLTNSRVYSKLTNPLEFKWAIRALIALIGHTAKLEYEDQQKYASAWVFFVTSSSVPYDLRLLSLKLIGDVLKSDHSREFSTSIIKAIFTTLFEHDNDTLYDFKNLSPLLAALTQIKDNEDLVKENLVKLIILANHEHIPLKGGWVGLAQRSGYNIDVGQLITTNLVEEFFAVINSTGDSKHSLYKAVIKATGIIAFIAPNVIAPLLAESFANEIKVDEIEQIDHQTLEIWRAKEGELVVDVLISDKKQVIDKNSKDYEIKKWEESIKKDISKTKKLPTKLTKEQSILINAQLAKESQIRSDVQTTINNVDKSIAIITELTNNATLADNGSRFWYPVAIEHLLNLSKTSTLYTIFGNAPIESYLNLSKLVSSRLGLLARFVGVATARIDNVQGLGAEYLEEPLLQLTGRILFRTKILSDQSPLDSLSLAFILPLLTRVLENGKHVAYRNSTKQAVTSEFLEEDPEEEQLLLAIEIIASHAEAFEDDFIPRISILEVLISLMKLPSKAKISKECFLSMCLHISVNVAKQDLKVLLDNIVTPNIFVRTSILESIDSEFDLHNELSYSNELWITAHDNDANSAEIATTIWSDNDLKVVEDAPKQLLKFSNNTDSGLRLSVAKAVVSAVEAISTPDIFDQTLQDLIDLYHEMKNPPPAVLDKYGLPIKSKSSQRDRWEERSTIALTLKLLTPLFKASSIEKVFRFLVDEEALGDKEDLVRQELQEAGVEIINVHGNENVEVLIPIFEANLASQQLRPTKAQNNIKECVIILYGALARHLDSSDLRLQIIIKRLLKTLDTPSEGVQYAISECIAPLVPSFELKLQKYIDNLFDKLFDGKTVASRRGAAYGIAGLIKGYGIKGLASFDIIRTLVDASDDKKNANRREGVSFAFECLSQSLGKFFEPYVIEVLPIILKSLGDAAPEVRLATDSAAKAIMRNTTSFGVKKLIPLAISNLDEVAWRSKKGSVELLGSMAYLDPTQLSASLSTIVPEIVGVLNDTHKEVRKAADLSLKRFGEVIRNPEIQVIVPDLLNAIGDPTKYTEIALDKLIKTQFVHYVDGPSLALIIHVIHRGMKDRSAATKKKACQIVGNMAILVDGKDLSPYLTQLVSELEFAMVDPVPATRSTAARALGSLVERLGEDQFPDLIPRLLDTLQDESKSGDRLGSAQALSEVICGLGVSKLEELLPGILAASVSPRNHVRAGYMPLLLFLPVCFGSQFSPYLTRIIPPILNGLADIDEDIRDTALRAGRLIVKNYAKKAVDLLLPELELGLADSNYRIRLSSLELSGDLLFQITGITGKNELAEEVETSGEVQKNLIDILGQERRDRVLSSLFVCRSDVSGMVRNAAVDIWKALVANTPRTVKEILPELTSIIIRRLASTDDDQRKIAAQTLGDMVRRVGTTALAQLLPTLEDSLTTSDTDAKQGICIALNELILSTQPAGLVEYKEVFIRIIREALTDPAPGVREAAALAFESLQEELGKDVIDDIIPHLLTMLDSDDSENALLALKDIMATKADTIFPILIPTLLAPPIDAFKAKALSSLASVAGSALYKRLPLIINTLIIAVIDSKSQSEEAQEEIKLAFDKILLAIDAEEGVHPLLHQILALVKNDDAVKRATMYQRLGNFFTHTTLDYSVYLQDMVSQFILSLGDPSREVVQGAFDALTALVQRQPKEVLDRLVKPARQALDMTGVTGEDLAAFTLPKGPNCILPIFLHGLMYGSADQREASAMGIADVIGKTPAANLKPFATSITGPLIRVIGEKVSSDIKAAILVALNNLLVKIGQFLRPFIPQLQRTFVRSLSDPTNESLRARAVVALGTLITYQPRVDSLVAELVSGARNAEEKGVKLSMLKGMLAVVDKSGKNMSEVSKTSIMSLVEEEITVVDEKSAVSYARLVGSLAKILSSEEAGNIIKSKILRKENNSDDKFCILSINSFLRYSPSHIFNTGLLDEIVLFIISCSNSTVDYISDNATVAIGKILLLVGEKKSYFVKDDSELASETPFELSEEKITKLATQLAINCLAPPSTSPVTRRLSLVVIRTLSRFKREEVVQSQLDILAPSVFACLRDPLIPVKLGAEKAYLSVFDLIDDVEMNKFTDWFTGKTSISTVLGTVIVPRSVGDYTKRVAARLAGVERDRIIAGGDAETMFSDRFEDESEVWSVGGIVE